MAERIISSLRDATGEVSTMLIEVEQNNSTGKIEGSRLVAYESGTYQGNPVIVLKEGARLSCVDNEGVIHPLIFLGEYDVDGTVYKQPELGTTSYHTNINTNDDPNYGIHVTCDTPEGKKVFAYTEDIITARDTEIQRLDLYGGGNSFPVEGTIKIGSVNVNFVRGNLNTVTLNLSSDTNLENVTATLFIYRNISQVVAMYTVDNISLTEVNTKLQDIAATSLAKIELWVMVGENLYRVTGVFNSDLSKSFISFSGLN